MNYEHEISRLSIDLIRFITFPYHNIYTYLLRHKSNTVHKVYNLIMIHNKNYFNKQRMSSVHLCHSDFRFFIPALQSSLITSMTVAFMLSLQIFHKNCLVLIIFHIHVSNWYIMMTYAKNVAAIWKI